MTKAEAIKARIYVRNIQAGLVPSDNIYDAVYDAIASHGGTDFILVNDEDMIKMAEEIKNIRK